MTAHASPVQFPLCCTPDHLHAKAQVVPFGAGPREGSPGAPAGLRAEVTNQGGLFLRRQALAQGRGQRGDLMGLKRLNGLWRLDLQ